MACNIEMADKIIAALRKFPIGLKIVGIMVQVNNCCRADVEQALQALVDAGVISVSSESRYSLWRDLPPQAQVSPMQTVRASRKK